MRILAIDYGQNKTGLAMTDPLRITAQGFKIIHNKNNDKIILSELRKIIEEYEIDTIVVGMPINLDGTESARMVETKKFLHKVKCDCPKLTIDTIDERLTTKQAQNTLNDMNAKSTKKKELEDILSATYILQVYMEKTK